MSTIQRFLEKEALLKGQQRHQHRQEGGTEGEGKGCQPGPSPAVLPSLAARGPDSPQNTPDDLRQPSDLPKEL